MTLSQTKITEYLEQLIKQAEQDLLTPCREGLSMTKYSLDKIQTEARITAYRSLLGWLRLGAFQE